MGSGKSLTSTFGSWIPTLRNGEGHETALPPLAKKNCEGRLPWQLAQEMGTDTGHWPVKEMLLELDMPCLLQASREWLRETDTALNRDSLQ